MIDFTLTLENEKVLLRPMEVADIPNLLKLTSNPEMWRFFTHDLSDLDGLQTWASPAFEKHRLQFLIIDKSSGEIAGATAFGNISERDLRLEIGWTWLGVEFQGIGLNSEVKKILLTYCFEFLGLERVEFKTDVLNLQARKALRNISAIEEGVLRSHTMMTMDRRRDTIYYSILKQEWEYVKRENEW